MLPQFPIYIPSKGRAFNHQTPRALDRMGVPYKIVVEDVEYDQYAAKLEPSKILRLPFSNLGQGSIPARNFILQHAIAAGMEKHWEIDDNVRIFYRLNRNLKIPCMTGTMFRCMEDFAARYDRVALAGPHYEMFALRKTKHPPFIYNHRIYSCILIDHAAIKEVGPWRGRYNEDTDLSLRCLKAGYRTILFFAFLAHKKWTMQMKGGNTDELHKGDGRLKMAESLVEQHPDVATITWKWGRWQHQVDYSPFKRNKLVLKPDVVVEDGPNEYGMVLQMDEGAVLPH